MATVVTKNGREEISDSDPKMQAYNALRIASNRIGFNNYVPGYYFYVTDGHRDVIDAMNDVLCGHISPDEAMSLLQRGDVLNQRIGVTKPPIRRRRK